MAAEAPILRPARVLLGWLSDKQARGVLNSHRPDVELTEEQRRGVEAARAALATRQKSQLLSPIVAPCPDVQPRRKFVLIQGIEQSLAD